MKRTYLFCVFILIQLIFSCQAIAQQRIVTVPNAEYLDKGVVLARLGYRFNYSGDNKYTILSPEIIYGIGHKSELFTGTIIDPSGKANTRLDLAAKKVFTLTKDQNTRFTTVYRIQPDLEDTQTPLNIAYAHLTQYIPKTRSRLTAGMYITNGIRAHNSFLPDKPGVVLGFEELIIPKKFILAIDWTSRNEVVGVLGVATKYYFTPNFYSTTGVVIPNGKRSRFGFTVLLGYYLNRKS